MKQQVYDLTMMEKLPKYSQSPTNPPEAHELVLLTDNKQYKRNDYYLHGQKYWDAAALRQQGL